MDAIEEKLAHLIRANDDLSDVVAAQALAIDRLEAQVAFLLKRARDSGESDGGVFIGDERPPHW